MPDGQDSSSSDAGNNGASNGTVPESDLIALKRSHASEVTELNEKITKLTSDMDALTTARTAVEAQLKEAEEVKAQLSTANAKVEETTKTLAETSAKLSETRRSQLMERHGLKEDSLKDMSEDQLDALEKVLPAVKTEAPDPKNLDAGSGPNAPPADLSARETIAASLAAD